MQNLKKERKKERKKAIDFFIEIKVLIKRE
ncbi:MAG: hypothetical protein ACJATI_005272 [Halioglobus sp.]